MPLLSSVMYALFPYAPRTGHQRRTTLDIPSAPYTGDSLAHTTQRRIARPGGPTHNRVEVYSRTGAKCQSSIQQPTPSRGAAVRPSVILVRFPDSYYDYEASPTDTQGHSTHMTHRTAGERVCWLGSEPLQHYNSFQFFDMWLTTEISSQLDRTGSVDWKQLHRQARSMWRKFHPPAKLVSTIKYSVLELVNDPDTCWSKYLLGPDDRRAMENALILERKRLGFTPPPVMRVLPDYVRSDGLGTPTSITSDRSAVAHDPTDETNSIPFPTLPAVRRTIDSTESFFPPDIISWRRGYRGPCIEKASHASDEEDLQDPRFEHSKRAVRRRFIRSNDLY